MEFNDLNFEAFDILLITLLATFSYTLYIKPELHTKLKLLTRNKIWLFSLIILLSWSYYVFYMKNSLKIYKQDHQQKAIVATKHALIGFIITICGLLDLTIYVYWLTWIISFYLEGWF